MQPCSLAEPADAMFCLAASMALMRRDVGHSASLAGFRYRPRSGMLVPTQRLTNASQQSCFYPEPRLNLMLSRAQEHVSLRDTNFARDEQL